MCKRPVKLVRLGKPYAEWTQAVSKSGLKDHVIELEFVPSERMQDIYNSVDCLLFPSWYEGFGWPPLEAMSCGTPVVTSNVASLPEVVGNAGFMLAPDDVEGLSCAVYSLLEDLNVRQNFVQRGLARAKLFNWESNIMETLKIYEQITVVKKN
jgi:glycosyltransferase involved in cell wall biosynthesis